jgi:hypothetical protein
MTKPVSLAARRAAAARYRSCKRLDELEVLIKAARRENTDAIKALSKAVDKLERLEVEMERELDKVGEATVLMLRAEADE